ncbi:MAG: ComF family protein [Clostridia bacterium]|nr:ComF family protein [Clostridia bacterium]
MSLLFNLLFPPKCASCGQLLPHDIADAEALCPVCRAEWESEILETCGICAKPVGECSCMTERMGKAKCAGFSKLVYYYPGKRQRVQNRLIYTVKQSREQRAAAFLARELARNIEALLKQEGISNEEVVLTYIPRGSRSKMQYGTDQAKVLATLLGKQTALEVRPTLRRRFGRGRPQKKLDPAGRYRNAKESFAPMEASIPALHGKTVILVDDIVTTGSSMAVGIRLLRQMGARRVYALAVASDIVNRDVGVY